MADPSKMPDTPITPAQTAELPSRSAVDFEELDRLFALMPEGPWHSLRTGDSHEIRQIDTDPTNKHHWPFRLCQSIAGQRAACDDAVFAFIAGVLNAWPSISEANSDDAFINRTLAMPEEELRKRFLIDGKCPEQAADIARQSFRIAELKVALMQISSQYVVNRGDMTDAEALEAIKKIADKALAGGTRSAQADALAKLAEIPPAGSEERDFWLEAAEQHGFEPIDEDGYTRGEEERHIATERAILTLMSEARKQGQADVLGAVPSAQQDAPVQWGDPKTIAGLIAQLRTLPPDAPIYGTFHGPDFPGEGHRRTGVRGVIVSREYVKGRWMSRDPDAELQHVIWTKPAPPEHEAEERADVATGGARHG